MSRIFWDTTLFVYLLDGHPQYSERVLYLIERARLRGDSLYTNYRALGEVIAGAEKSPNPGRTHEIRSILDGPGFSPCHSENRLWGRSDS